MKTREREREEKKKIVNQFDHGRKKLVNFACGF